MKLTKSQLKEIILDEIGKLKENTIQPKNVIAYYNAIAKAEGVKPIPIKFGSEKWGGASTTYNSITMKPLHITIDLNRVNDVEFAILHELTHQIKLETEKDPYAGKRDQTAKFLKLQNKLIDKYMYSNYSNILFKK